MSTLFFHSQVLQQLKQLKRRPDSALLLTLARVFALVLAFALVGVLSRAPVTHLLCILWAEGAVLRPAACLALPYAVRRVRNPHTLWHAIFARHAAGLFDIDNGFAT